MQTTLVRRSAVQGFVYEDYEEGFGDGEGGYLAHKRKAIVPRVMGGMKDVNVPVLKWEKLTKEVPQL